MIACERARRRRARGLRAAAILAAAAVSAGCGRAPLSRQFFAERDLWRARMIERRVELRRETSPDRLSPAVEAYERILRRYPAAAAGADTAVAGSIARVRGTAAQTLSRLYFRQGSRARAVSVLWSERETLRGHAPALVGIYGDLVQLMARSASTDTLESLYREMAATLPPGTGAGTPYPLVLEAPARLGELLRVTRRTSEAEAAFAEALSYYDRVVTEHPGAPLEVAAAVQKANVLARTGRVPEAEEVLRAAQAMRAAGPVAAGIVFSQAVLREQMLRRPLEAVPLYREVQERWPESESAVQAALRIGIAHATAGQPDSALRAFDLAEERFPRNLALAAQARYLGARVLMDAGRGEEGIRRLRSVTTDFPRSDVGLMAPLDIATYYEKAGNTTAERATLREAEGAYRRHWEDLKDDPRQADFVRSALDRLSEVCTRLQDWSGAVQALLLRAEAFPGDEMSPLALAQAASLSDTKLADRAASVRILQALVERYPGHPMSPKAKEKITELGGSGS